MRLFSGLLFPCLLFNVLSVLAIFKDDAYHTDWHIPLIGPSLATSTFFHRPSPDTKASLIYTLTSRSILAAINPKDGGVVWRQQLPETGGNGVARGGNGVVVSAVGTHVASFSAGNGRLVWENEFSKKILDLGVTNENTVALLFEDGTVRLLSEETGDVAWEWKGLDSKDIPLSIHVSDSVVTVSSSQASKKVHLTSISLSTGVSPSSAISVSASVDLPVKHQALHGDHLLSWTSASERKLKFLPLGFGASPVSVAIPNDVMDTVVMAINDIVLIHFKTYGDSWADVYKLDFNKGTAEMVYSLNPKIGAHSAFSLSASDNKAYVIWTLSNGETILYGTKSEDVLASYTLPEMKDIDVTHAISEVVPRPDGSSFAVRTFLSSSSPGFVGNTYLVRNGELAWSRNESLSSIVATTWVELLDPTIEDIVDKLDVEAHKSVGAAYVHRLTRHAHELAEYGPGWLRALPHRIYNAFLSEDNLENEHTGKWRDFFGFRKFAIVVTAEGGLAALDVGKNGEVVWKTALVSVDGAKFKGVSGIYEVRKGTVGVVFANGEYAEYNGFEGTLLFREALSAAVRTTVVVDTPGQKRVILALLENEEVVTLPLGGDHELEPVYLTIQESSRAVRGLQISSSLKLATTWTFVPPASEEIMSLFTRPLHDPVASIGRVTGDRSVMYKYLNQHLLVITTINPILSTATVYLLDSVSGSVLHSATHTGVDTTQPIVATVSENWVVYTYFGDDDVVATSGAAKAYHLVVSDLYESEFKNDRGALGAAENVTSLATGDGGRKPHVVSQSYIFPSPITTFAITSTKQSITSREILALLPGSAGIYSIPKRIMDPRRPVGRDADLAEREEGLFMYSPVIEIDPKSIITHERKPVGLRNIVTTPSQLESTSIVFAYGGDLFGTRVSPSLAFDLLGKGFGKVQLVLTVVGLAVGAAAVAPMVRKKQINSRWITI